MMSAGMPATPEPEAVRPAVTSITSLKPYAKAIILEHTGPDLGSAVRELMKWLKEKKDRERARRSVRIIASGVSYNFGEPEIDSAGASGWEIDGFVAEVRSPPAWAGPDSPLTEITLDLFLVVRQRRLVAIHCGDSSLNDALQVWLDKSPRPPFRRIPAGVLNAGLLSGDAKGLWLRGTHVQRATKPDSKVLHGRSVQTTLTPHQDYSFSFSSARAELPESDDGDGLAGTVGTTPRRSLVWIRPTTDLTDFVSTMSALLDLLEKQLNDGISLERPYPWLAIESRDLSPVLGAYELSTLGAEELAGSPDCSEEALDAAAFLETVTFDVVGDGVSADFVADVAFDGSSRGRIACVVHEDDGRIRMKVGFAPERPAQDSAFLREVIDALEFEDLLTVYYQSGHALSRGSIYSSEIRAQPFDAWKWMDFAGHQVRHEKPPGKPGQEIHDAIALPGDDSLFAWVVKEFSPGAWLTCDDGSGEVADFVRYDADDKLTLIHVKGSSNANSNRPINATAYEQVVSQATKNLLFLDPDRLARRLARTSSLRPASWIDGARVDDRSEFLTMLANRPQKGALEVIIVQPQVTQVTYSRVSALVEVNTEVMRLRLLETMLHSARGAAMGLGANLSVIGDASVPRT